MFAMAPNTANPPEATVNPYANGFVNVANCTPTLDMMLPRRNTSPSPAAALSGSKPEKVCIAFPKIPSAIDTAANGNAIIIP